MTPYIQVRNSYMSTDVAKNDYVKWLSDLSDFVTQELLC